MGTITDIVIFIFGAVLGSFLNVCIHRLPKEEVGEETEVTIAQLPSIFMKQIRSIATPPSNCPHCKHPIRFYDNIPIVSYIILGGKCRDCGIKISVRYPIVELLTAVLCFVLYRKLGISFEFLVSVIFVALLVVISFIDLDFQIIPDILSIGGLIVGLFLAIFRPFFIYLSPKFNVLDSLYGVLLGGGVLFIIAYSYKLIAKREGMGGGDIKLLAMIGSFCGIKGVIFSLMAGSLFGTVVGIPVMLAKGKNTKYAIPFGPFLALGAVVYLYKGNAITLYFINLMTGR
ncbi:MAG: prepilin peptidase [Syntrophorhabdaceae bacterium]|nr:prepilin peptidase [Syntrophorhabdaceae bacterium]MDD5243113.1 prepilin peptidase [Syntrophorhabdaceae bacterium]